MDGGNLVYSRTHGPGEEGKEEGRREREQREREGGREGGEKRVGRE